MAWKQWTLRTWLNKDFMEAAFNAEESEKIQNSEIENQYNYDFCYTTEYYTTDKLFLLNIDETKKYFKTNEERTSEITNHGIMRIAKAYNMTEKEIKEKYFSEANNNWNYWLRSPGDDQNLAANVDYDGSVNEDGNDVNYVRLGVRPALWVNL